MTTLVKARVPASTAYLRSPRQIWTEAHLMALPKEDGKYELVDGELELTPPAKPEHGECSADFMIDLGMFVRRHKLGRCYDGQTGFWMNSGNLRSPDISFITHERIKTMQRATHAFFCGAPDLAVEVLSPSDRPARIAGKLKDYFASGSSLVWLIDPRAKTVRVHRAAADCKVLGVKDTLRGEDVLPGFKLPLSKLFGK